MDGVSIYEISGKLGPFLASNYLAISMSLPRVAELLAFLDTLYLDLIAQTPPSPDP